jgi:L-threonylcarbamoyladenylate synthase
LAEILVADLDGLARAARVVADGGVVCYPTDTLYGLGCDPLNARAVERTNAVKGQRTKPMPVLVKDLPTAEKYAHLTNRARRLAEVFWPGPLTLVLESQKIVPGILAPDGRIGIRSPEHSICLSLLGLCSGALVGTSANMTGKSPATTAEEASRQIGDKVDVILDGGNVALGVASTVVDLTGPKLAILREGPVGREQLMRALRRVRPR